ncbi:MAG: hypothetical protein EON60_03975 [Alphaproteobacteria bacterium]|nr:MAG: hypothetical protein EON60_03975 [Alphaproteobacteria bacterium]
MTISRKLLLILAILIAGIIGITTAVSGYNQTRQLHAMYNQLVEATALQLGSASRGGLRWNQAGPIEKTVTEFLTTVKDSHLEAFFAIKPDNSILWEKNEDPEHYDFIKKYLAVSAADGATPQTHVFEEDDHVAVLVPLIDADSKTVTGYNITFWNDGHLFSKTLEMIALQAGLGLVLLLVGLGILTSVIRSILINPVSRLIAMSNSLANKLENNLAQLQGTMAEMSTNAHRTSQKTASVQQNSSQTASNVQQVAAGAEELASSLVGVAHTVEETGNLVSGAITQANQSKEVISSLVQASQNISQVTNLIAEIAEQTNLLALNASIEAARAGEAGRGFAVVADEIKKLASTTGQATADITKQVQQISQTATNSSQALTSIASSVQRIHEQTSAIRTSVNEQSSVTQDITRNMSEASLHVQEVDSQLSEVNRVANVTGEMSEQLLNNIESLKTDTDAIMTELKTFGKRI